MRNRSKEEISDTRPHCSRNRPTGEERQGWQKPQDQRPQPCSHWMVSAQNRSPLGLGYPLKSLHLNRHCLQTAKIPKNKLSFPTKSQTEEYKNHPCTTIKVKLSHPVMVRRAEVTSPSCSHSFCFSISVLSLQGPYL